MNRTLLALALLVFTSVLGFSQTGSTPTPLITPPANRNDMPGNSPGLVTDINGQTITVKTEAANPVSFALGKKVQFVNTKGRKVKANAVKPGARVRVIYEGTEDTRTATKIIVGG
jgi:endonuclease YncB( thermonuclease family)